jgi:DNA polymerase III epsilon subunit-like protein
MSHILAIDLESTGLDVEKCNITEIALSHINGEEVLSSFSIKMNPSESSVKTLYALKLTSREINSNEYISQEEGFYQLMRYLLKEVFPKLGNKKLDILGHNCSFDIKMLQNFLLRYNVTGWAEIFNYSIKDTSTIGNFLRECGVLKLDKMSLMNLAECLGIEVDKTKAHGAVYDKDITVQCFFKMKKLLSNINKDSINYNQFLDRCESTSNEIL